MAYKVRQVLGSEGRPLEGEANANSVSTSVAERVALRVLVVDHDEPTRDAASELLRMLAHCPTTAPGAHASLDAIDNAAFGMLLIDVHMPDISGIELAHRIATDHKDVSVIFASVDTIHDGSAGDSHWQSLRKPYTVDQLEAALRKSRQGNS